MGPKGHIANPIKTVLLSPPEKSVLFCTTESCPNLAKGFCALILFKQSHGALFHSDINRVQRFQCIKHCTFLEKEGMNMGIRGGLQVT